MRTTSNNKEPLESLGGRAVGPALSFTAAPRLPCGKFVGRALVRGQRATPHLQRSRWETPALGQRGQTLAELTSCCCC